MQPETTDKPRRPRKERPQRDGMIGAARQLRSNPTEAETVLWEALRRKQADGMRFRRQRVIGPYIVDFCCLGHNLIVEVDGAHHHDSEHAAYDADRTEFLEAHGFRVLRFDNSAVLNDVDGVVARILDPSLPTSLPSAEGKEE
jgi:very-short-patch-repair endonuclease